VLKSGNPPISGTLLAPTESGAQIVRLPKEVFVTRCLLTPGTTSTQCRTFYAKLWTMQIDSRNLALAASNSAKTAAKLASERALRAARDAEERLTVPFDRRIKPGMFVRWSSKGQGIREETAMVLAPEFAFFGRDDEGFGIDIGPYRRYICARAVKGAMEGSFMLDVGDQMPVGVKDMEGEVLLEFDAATRYYFLKI